MKSPSLPDVRVGQHVSVAVDPPISRTVRDRDRPLVENRDCTVRITLGDTSQLPSPSAVAIRKKGAARMNSSSSGVRYEVCFSRIVRCGVLLIAKRSSTVET